MKSFRRLQAAVHLVRLAKDPNRLEEVFTVADRAVTPEILIQIANHFASDPKGDRALDERPRLGKLDLVALGKLPEGTLGRAFADHMKKNDLDPAAIPNMPSPDRLSYARAHLYETHDIWHAVTGFDTDVAGELGLQAFGLAQFPARLAVALLVAGLVNTLLYKFEERDARMDQIARGWIMGRRAKMLFGTRWNEMWLRPIDEVRRELNVVIEPMVVAPKTSEAAAAQAA